MTTGAWILVVAVALAVGIGLWRAATDGRFRAQQPASPPGVAPGPDADAESEPAEQPSAVAALVAAGVPHELGERATLLQFSSAFCAPCRATRRVLSDVAGSAPGVVHLEVDAEGHLDLVRRLGVLRTPTTLVLDASGREVARAAGAPRPEQVRQVLPDVDLA